MNSKLILFLALVALFCASAVSGIGVVSFLKGKAKGKFKAHKLKPFLLPPAKGQSHFVQGSRPACRCYYPSQEVRYETKSPVQTYQSTKGGFEQRVDSVKAPVQQVYQEQRIEAVKAPVQEYERKGDRIHLPAKQVQVEEHKGGFEQRGEAIKSPVQEHKQEIKSDIRQENREVKEDLRQEETKPKVETQSLSTVAKSEATSSA